MCGINDSQVILVVAICIRKCAVTAITTYKMDITNIAMPATDPTIFSDFMPRDATHMKKINSASVSPCNATTVCSLINEPSPFSAHPSAIRIACGFAPDRGNMHKPIGPCSKIGQPWPHGMFNPGTDAAFAPL